MFSKRILKFEKYVVKNVVKNARHKIEIGKNTPDYQILVTRSATEDELHDRNERHENEDIADDESTGLSYMDAFSVLEWANRI